MPESADMGRNLLRGAGLGSLDTITEGGIAYRSIHSGKDGMQAVVDGIDGNKGYQITTGSDEKNVYRGVFFIAAVNKGETYTLSAWVKGTAGNTLWMEFINNNGTERKNSDGTSGTYQSATFNLTDGWQRVSHTFTVDNKNAGYVECNFFTNESGTFTICEPKLERGDVATAFCLNEADLAAAVYEIVLSPIFNASYSLHTDESNSADNNALDLTISGGFSVYTVVDGARKLYDGDDLSFVLIASPYSANGKVANGTGTVSLSQSNIDAELAPVTAYLAVFRGTQDNTLATKNITISMHPRVLIDDKNGLLVKVNDNTKSIGTIKNDGKTISAKVQEIGDGLSATGVDISNHKIEMTADNFTLKNNKKEVVFGTDADKNIFVTGTIRANNFFRKVCVWNYFKHAYYFKDGVYYSEQEVEDKDLVTDDMIVNSGPADLVIVPFYSKEATERVVCLPDANDYEGKIIEVVDTDNNTNVDLIVKAVNKLTSSAAGHFFGSVSYSMDGGGKITHGTDVQDINVGRGKTTRFYSLRLDETPSEAAGTGLTSYCYWLLLKN